MAGVDLFAALQVSLCSQRCRCHVQQLACRQLQVVQVCTQTGGLAPEALPSGANPWGTAGPCSAAHGVRRKGKLHPIHIGQNILYSALPHPSALFSPHLGNTRPPLILLRFPPPPYLHLPPLSHNLTMAAFVPAAALPVTRRRALAVAPPRMGTDGPAGRVSRAQFVRLLVGTAAAAAAAGVSGSVEPAHAGFGIGGQFSGGDSDNAIRGLDSSVRSLSLWESEKVGRGPSCMTGWSRSAIRASGRDYRQLGGAKTGLH